MKTFALPPHSIAVYTVLCILCRMRKQLGLDAMLEYLEQYLAAIETHNPQLGNAVKEEMSRINVEKMYEDAVGRRRS